MINPDRNPSCLRLFQVVILQLYLKYLCQARHTTLLSQMQAPNNNRPQMQRNQPQGQTIQTQFSNGNFTRPTIQSHQSALHARAGHITLPLKRGQSSYLKRDLNSQASQNSIQYDDTPMRKLINTFRNQRNGTPNSAVYTSNKNISPSHRHNIPQVDEEMHNEYLNYKKAINGKTPGQNYTSEILNSNDSEIKNAGIDFTPKQYRQISLEDKIVQGQIKIQDAAEFRLFGNYINTEAKQLEYQSPTRRYSYRTIENPVAKYETLKNSQFSGKVSQVSNHLANPMKKSTVQDRESLLKQAQRRFGGKSNVSKASDTHRIRSYTDLTKLDGSSMQFNNSDVTTNQKHNTIHFVASRQQKLQTPKPPPHKPVQIVEQDKKWISDFPLPQYRYFDDKPLVKTNSNKEEQKSKKSQQHTPQFQRKDPNIPFKYQEERLHLQSEISQVTYKLKNIEDHLINRKNFKPKIIKKNENSLNASQPRAISFAKNNQKRKQSQNMGYSFSGIRPSHEDEESMRKQSRTQTYNFAGANSQKPVRQYRIISNKILMNKESKELENVFLKQISKQKYIPQSPQLNKKNSHHESGQDPMLEELITSVEEPEYVKNVPLNYRELHHSISSPAMNNYLKNLKQSYYLSAVLLAFRNTSQPPTMYEEIARSHFLQSLEIINIPVLEKYKQMQAQKLQKNKTLLTKSLARTSKKMFTIVFDLDETLIHCTHSLDVPYEYQIPIKLPNGTTAKTGINVRPHVHECLTELSKYFELMIYTASHYLYADSIIDSLVDSRKVIFREKFYRDSCIKVEEPDYNVNFYMKDLRVIDRDMDNMLLIDNAPYSYYFQLDNGVPVIPFFKDKEDSELKELTKYLKHLLEYTEKESISIREANKRFSKLHKYKNKNFNHVHLNYNDDSCIRQVINQIYDL